MEFLVRIGIGRDPAISAELAARESARASQLRAEGLLVRIWRIPGQTANWSLYEARDATQLHAILSSLPLWPWMDIEVHALARHPAEGSPPST